MKLVSLVIPFYNEEEMCELFFNNLFKVIDSIDSYSFELVCVNDGSKDNTLELLKKEQEEHKEIKIVNLSRNFGHESAVAAGLSVAKGDAIIPMDADLQDPPEVIPELLKKYEEGYDVVNAKRAARKSDTALKRNTASLFYKIIGKWSGKVKVPNNVGHFRLISRKVLNKVLELGEVTRVFRVEVPFVGYKTTTIEFSRPERAKGETHYNYKSMIDLAEDSVISTTNAPLRLILKAAIGSGVVTALSILTHIVFAILNWCGVNCLSSTNIWLWFIANLIALFGTIILVALAIMAEYEGKIFKEAQHRPFFIIDEIIEGKK